MQTAVNTDVCGFQEVLFVFDFNKPNIEMTESSEDKRFGRFVAEPLERGYGTTLGNSLRRIMLASRYVSTC